MGKIVAAVLFLTLVFPSPFVFSQTAAFSPGSPASIENSMKIGVVAATKGKVEVAPIGVAGRIVQSGEGIFVGDQVKTDSQGHLQILLLDQTVFTIGPDSAIVIDEFVYDPSTHNGQMEASISQGVFRYVSGKIAAKKSSNVKINLPNATIGIRGTIVADEAGSQGSLAMLLGPGSNNDAGATVGNFTISGFGPNSGQSQNVNRTGFGVEVGSNGNLSGVFQVPETRVSQLAAGLVPGLGSQMPGAAGGGQPGIGGQTGQGGMPGQGPGGGLFLGGHARPNMQHLSGGDRVVGFNTASHQLLAGWFLGNIIKDTTDAAIFGSEEQGTTIVPTGPSRIFDLIKLTTGIFRYSGSGVFNEFKPYPTQGSFSASIDIDFGSKTIGGGHSFVSISGTESCNKTASLGRINYGGLPGEQLAHFVIPSSEPAAKVFLDIFNSGGRAANQAFIGVKYDKEPNISFPDGIHGAGSVNVPISPGPTPEPPKIEV